MLQGGKPGRGQNVWRRGQPGLSISGLNGLVSKDLNIYGCCLLTFILCKSLMAALRRTYVTKIKSHYTEQRLRECMTAQALFPLVICKHFSNSHRSNTYAKY